MTEILLRLARDATDIEAARELCREWLAWHWENYPADWPTPTDPDWLVGVEHPMDPESFQTILDDLPERHKRPGGGIFVAYVNGHPAGCVMYNAARPGVAEFHRMFVSEKDRGNRLGEKLLNAMFAQMIADGYTRVFFSSATFLKHARTMYRNAGFVDMTHPEDFPHLWRDKVYFMERALV
ncbi:MAG: GNAT family N-acetyltransferase [Roseobacter sp.]|jgi:GNAT superfamily N-acetyltransferase|nr:GNAT family N-acetyltransferase [Roseobacter sp.]